MTPIRMKTRVTFSSSGTRRTSRRYGRLLMLAALGCAVAIGGHAGAARSTSPAPCAQARPSSSSQLRLTTIGTIEQAYECIFAHYYSGPVLDDRTLLVGAFAGFTQELERSGIDNSHATLPPLDGNRYNDWNAFAAAYQQVESHLPASNKVRQTLASATLTGMVSSLEDNHVRWEYAPTPPNSTPADQYGLGLQTSPSLNLLTAAPAETVAPLFVTSIQGGPASRDHIRPGDTVLSVNAAPPFANRLPSPGVIDLLFESYPQDEPMRITFHRPATGRTWTVKITPTLYQPSAASSQFVSTRKLDGNIADIKISAFAPGVADTVLKAISRLGGSKLHGVILDLRGDTGGLPPEVSALLGAFVHDKGYSYDCTVRGSCTTNSVDNATPLLHLPLVVLTDRNCVSACEAFSAAVKDLHIGTLVGTRTGGIVAGPATPYVLNDQSVLTLPARHELAADHELINGIGVAPDYYLPRTADDLSTGHDPDLAKARNLLTP
jgi:carboxyl-terminal processing protease